MIRKIGKYQILERIGRGGMGIVYKARDPLLDRVVALKVIANDIDVTEEIRARFFREAQACARLNHPNIVTVYDMGEEEGQLFIVMEFLEGRELRQLIAARQSLLVEDKLAVMIQVCEGLQYAHQNGIVHRDVKPANIFILRNGLVKILDFGLAHIATETNLTRAGLVVGTLRYISPEQVRGRADHRSDIFSVGAVFYELLTLRPPFEGPDPMQILEQLRSEEPPTPSAVDPTIPRDLSAIIDRALRKDPAQRFADLSEMRGQLADVQRRFVEEAQRLRAEVEAKLGRIRELEAALASHLGVVSDATSPIAVDGQARVATLETLNQSLARRIERLQALLEKAEALKPEYQRGLELIQAGAFDEAVSTLEAVTGQLPEHEPAATALAEARRKAEDARRHAEVRRRLDEGAAAFAKGAFAESLESLKELDEMAATAGLTREVVELRGSATAALTVQQEKLRRQRTRAEQAAALTSESRTLAEEAEAFRRAEAQWLAAEVKAAEAGTAFDQKAYARATEAHEAAAALYHRAEEEAREAVRREQLEGQRREAERIRQRWLRSREAADAVAARERAQTRWAEAERKSEDGRTAFEQGTYTRAAELFDQAVTLCRQATDMARESMRREEAEREEREARLAQEAAHQARVKATGPNAAERAAGRWGEAETRLSEAEAALGQASYARAKQLFGAAVGAFAAAEQSAIQVLGREREQSEAMRVRVVQGREAAEAVVGHQRAAAQWAAAEAKASEGETWVARERYREARQAFEAAVGLFRDAEGTAREAIRQERARAEQARVDMAPRRSAAVEQLAAQNAAPLWGQAEAKAAEAESAFGEARYKDASPLFESAAALYEQAEREGREAIREAERQRQRETVERAAELMRQVRAAAAGAETVPDAREAWQRAEAQAAAAARAFQEEQYPAATQVFDEATALFRLAEAAVREAAHQEEASRQAEEARRSAEVRGRLDDAGAFFARGAYAECLARMEGLDEQAAAVGLVGEVTELRRALAAALAAEAATHQEELRRQRVRAEEASALAAEGRSLAEEVEAPRRAESQWLAAEAQTADAKMAFEAESFGQAAAAFDEARALYHSAEVGAREAARREQVEQERREAERTRQRLLRRREAADGVGARERAPAVWAEADRKFEDGQTAFEQRAYARATELFDQAIVLSRQAVDAAREDTRREEGKREQREVELAQESARQAREAAVIPHAAKRASGRWGEGEAKLGEAEAALAQGNRAQAKQLFDAAASGFAVAAETARELLGREREGAAAVRARMMAGREAAQRVDPAEYASALWGAADARAAEGEVAFGRGEYLEASLAFEAALSLFQDSERAAGETLGRERERAAQARELITSVRAAAAEQSAAQNAVPSWGEAEAKGAEAESAFAGGRYSDAVSLFEGASALYQRAEREGRDAIQRAEQQRQREAAKLARERMQQARAAATGAETLRGAQEAWQRGESRAAAGRTAFQAERYPDAGQAFDEATTLFRQAEAAVRDAAHQEELRHGREAADRSRDRMSSARAAAAQTDAPRRAADLWSAAEARSTAGSEAFGREEYSVAAQTFEAALDFYQRAEGAARDTVRQQEERSERERAEQARQVTARRRATTAEIHPEEHAPTAWSAAEGQAAEAETLLVQGKYTQAAQIFTRATEGYRRAEEAARRALADRDRPRTSEAPAVDAPVPQREVVVTEQPRQAGPAAIPAAATEERLGVAAPVAGEARDAEVRVSPTRAGSRRLLLVGIGAGALVLAAIALVPALRGLRSTPERETVQPTLPAQTQPPREPAPPPQVGGQPSGDPKRNVDELKKQVTAARDGAVKADSERLVPKPWSAAKTQDQAAAAALAQGQLGDAQALYREALDGYVAAANEARALKEATAQKQEGSRRLQDQASAARRAAELAQASKLASDQWGKATGIEQAAQNARDRSDFDKASNLYRDAATAFQGAEKEALRQASAAEAARLAKLKEELQDAEQARAGASRARGDAGAQEAQTYAAQTLAQGLQREKDGEAALTRQDYANAKDAFLAARKDYEAAAAQSAKLKGERQAAEQASTAAAGARGDALAQEAQTYAAQAMTRGQQREKEGEAALIRQDFRVAKESFQAARTDYGAAADAARRERARLREALKAEVNQARNRANALEQQAAGLDAERLAREPFQAARAKEREAEALASQENFPAARQGFLDAAQRYSDSVRVAQTQRELRIQADQAKANMLTARQSARQDSADYGAGATQERQASQLYDRLAFKESADAFRAAGDLYAKAVPQKPPPPPPAPVARTGSVLVTSNVPGAAVSVGEVTFETRTDAATEVRSLPVGKYQVRARLSGSKEWTGQVEIVQDGRSEVQISMEPLSPPPPPRAEPPQKPAPDSQKPGSSAPRRTMPSF
jgi:Protein kinase domain